MAAFPACFLYVLGNILWVQQPQPIRSSHVRLFVSFWFASITILSTAYRSGLISFLTYPITPPPIDTVQQLAQSSLNKIMFTDYYQKELINSSDPWRRQLGRQLIITHNLTGMYALLDQEDEAANWAMDSSMDSLRYVAAGRPNLHMMKECLFPTLSSFGFRRNSALKIHFDRAIQRLIETGLIDYHRRRVLDGTGRKKQRINETSSSSFSLQDLQGAFYLLVIGWIVSVVILSTEMSWRRLNDS